MFDERGTSDVGTADADAPPTSEKVKPAAPNAGTAFATRFRFEASLTPGIVVPPYLQKNVSSSAAEILRFENAVCKVGWYGRRAASTGFHVDERHVHERFRSRDYSVQRTWPSDHGSEKQPRRLNAALRLL
jgi:hypothetical protein